MRRCRLQGPSASRTTMISRRAFGYGLPLSDCGLRLSAARSTLRGHARLTRFADGDDVLQRLPGGGSGVAREDMDNDDVADRVCEDSKLELATLSAGLASVSIGALEVKDAERDSWDRVYTTETEPTACQQSAQSIREPHPSSSQRQFRPQGGPRNWYGIEGSETCL